MNRDRSCNVTITDPTTFLVQNNVLKKLINMKRMEITFPIVGEVTVLHFSNIP